MKTFVAIFLAVTVSIIVAQSPTPEDKDKTLEEKTSETLDKTKEKTSEAWDETKEKTKEAGRAVAETTKKAADAMVDALTPDADARKVTVKLTDHDIDMPTKLEAGKTAFVVRNAGKKKHNFEVEGEGVDKKFFAAVEPDETKVLHVNLKPGNYKVYCPIRDNAKRGMKVHLTVP